MNGYRGAERDQHQPNAVYVIGLIYVIILYHRLFIYTMAFEPETVVALTTGALI